MNSPCLKCENRTTGCHSKCEAYLNYRAHRDEVNERSYQESFAISYEMDSIHRAVKRRKR